MTLITLATFGAAFAASAAVLDHVLPAMSARRIGGMRWLRVGRYSVSLCRRRDA